MGTLGLVRCLLSEARRQAAAICDSDLWDDFGSDSDIDLLVVFLSDRISSLLGVADMVLELSQLFAGRKVDLRTAEDISPYFRQDVLDRAEVQYAHNSFSPHR